MNVMILFGGASYEHDVSIITGCVANNLLKNNYNIFCLYIDNNQNLYYMKDCCIEHFRDPKKGKKASFIKNGFKVGFKECKIDIAIIATHGINGEDGMSKSILDFYNISSIGSSLVSSAVNIDKYYSYCILKDNNINVVPSAFITKNTIDNNVEYPVIFKPCKLGSSIGINVVRNKEEYDLFIKESLKYDSKILIQKYLEDITELNISLYKNKESIITSKIEIVEKHENIYSYEDKYSKCKLEKRLYLEDKQLTDTVLNMAIKAYEVMELEGIVRIDFILHNNEVYLNEINTIPGSLSYYLYDKEFTDIIYELINYELFKSMKKKCFNLDSKILHYDYNMKK